MYIHLFILTSINLHHLRRQDKKISFSMNFPLKKKDSVFSLLFRKRKTKKKRISAYRIYLPSSIYRIMMVLGNLANCFYYEYDNHCMTEGTMWFNLKYIHSLYSEF